MEKYFLQVKIVGEINKKSENVQVVRCDISGKWNKESQLNLVSNLLTNKYTFGKSLNFLLTQIFFGTETNVNMVISTPLNVGNVNIFEVSSF